jgi:hypothetical protein
VPSYAEPTWTLPQTVPDMPRRGAAMFAASKGDMVALVIELLRSYLSMEAGLRHPALAGMVLRRPGDEAAGLRVVPGVSDDVNAPLPRICVYAAGQTPVQQFVDRITISTPEWSVGGSTRYGDEFIVLHAFAGTGAELMALQGECERFWAMLQSRLPDVCQGLIAIVPQKGDPMSTDEKGRLNVKVPASYMAHWTTGELPEDGY